MSPAERGRLIGIGQVVNGLLAIAAGALVAYLLSENGPPYPLNYAAIFGLAGTAFFLSGLAITGMVEIPEAVPETPTAPPAREFWPRLVELWRGDPVFARAIVVRLLVGLSELAAPFYILHATQVAGIGAGVVGSLAAVGSIGATLAGVWLGRVAARTGSQRVIQITSGLSILPPVLGLGLAFLPATPMLLPVYIACYLILGMVNGSWLLGYFNYILDLAPPGGRPIYMGVANSMGGLLVAAPILGGWILDSTSYPVLFGLTVLPVVAAALSALNLPPVQGRAPAPASEADLPVA
jgi:MFS family permease